MRAVALGLVLVLVACSGGPSQTDVAAALADEALVPQMEETSVRLAELASAVTAFCADPSESNLQSTRTAWHEAKEAWERTEVAVYYGPAMRLRTESKVDFEPVSPDRIEEVLASDSVLDVDYVDNRSSASLRGLGTIEYLIFGSLDQSGDPRRCELTTSAAVVAGNAAKAMLAGWTQGEAPFRDVFISTMDPSDAFADVVNAQYEILNRLAFLELGPALGVTSAERDLDVLAEGPAGAGVARYIAQLEGIEQSLIAGAEASLIELIRSRSAQVAEQIESHLDSAFVQLGSIEGPMTQAVENDPELMTAIFENLGALRDLFHVDVVSLLDLTLGFSDSDGDSG